MSSSAHTAPAIGKPRLRPPSVVDGLVVALLMRRLAPGALAPLEIHLPASTTARTSRATASYFQKMRLQRPPSMSPGLCGAPAAAVSRAHIGDWSSLSPSE